jgi:hypothetical protein
MVASLPPVDTAGIWFYPAVIILYTKHFMKTFIANILLLGVLAMVAGCDREPRIAQRPRDIVNVGDRTEVYQKIMTQFPEHQNVKTSQTALFEPTAAKHIELTAESDVYVTFIAEGAGYDNTFGWYSYNKNEKPANKSDIKLNVLFPKVSGQVLKQGDRLKLSDKKFPAGTVIGFFLIIKGWNYGQINYNNETFYTDTNYNTDSQQQHVLFKQKDLGDIVLAFEDQLVTHESDQDYNDILFTVSDNSESKAVSKFNMTNVVEL